MFWFSLELGSYYDQAIYGANFFSFFIKTKLCYKNYFSCAHIDCLILSALLKNGTPALHKFFFHSSRWNYTKVEPHVTANVLPISSCISLHVESIVWLLIPLKK